MGDKEQLLCLGGRHRVLVPPFLPSLEGNSCCTRKGLVRIVDREVSHELSGGTQFRGLGFLGTLKLGNLIEGLLTRAWLGRGEITSADNLKSRELFYLVECLAQETASQ